MGTHPIFESDFDCLTDLFIIMRSGAESVASAKSKSSRHSYRVRAKTSQVDETLFASPKKQNSNSKRETVQVITKVIVPSKDPSGQSVVLRRHNLNRIKSASKVKSQIQIENEAAQRQMEKEERVTQAAERKKHFAELDEVRKGNEELNDLEEEAKKENEYLLEKARLAKIEQEDKVKQLNELILDAKVHAIRDLQINEKSEIKADEEDEDKRLDVIMEVHRLNGMRQAERIEQEKIIQRREGARQILSQIQSNTEARLLEEEKKNAEAQALVDYMEKLQDEDVEELMRKREAQLILKQEVDEINRQALLQRERRAEQEKNTRSQGC